VASSKPLRRGKGSMLIADFFSGEYLPSRDMEPCTRVQYRNKIKHFGKWLGRPAAMKDLNEETVNAFLEFRLTERKRSTVRGDRAHLVAIWNAAYDMRFVDEIPRRVKRIKRGEMIVEGWTPDKLARLLKQCENPPFGNGRFRGKPISRPLYWRALVLFAYDTGLRLGDVQGIRFDQIRYPEPFTLIQHKTGKRISVAIREETWQAVQLLHAQAGQQLFKILRARYFFQSFKAIVAAAGITGTFKYLRRTSGSMVESIAPGSGGKHLGHADPTIFDRHYNVRELTDRPPVLPPAILAV